MANAARLLEAERNLTGVARRVLEAVPITETWPASLIATELARTGSRIDMRIVHGCLNSLKEQGLLKEPAPLHFTRVQARVIKAQPLRVVEPENTTTTQHMKTQPETPEKADPLVGIGTLAHRLRATGKALMEWADELEALGLEFETRVEQASKDGEKLRQLQALLKSLNT